MDSQRAFSPGWITGLFESHWSNSELTTGSTGYGFCLSRGVTTAVNRLSGTDTNPHITLQGRLSSAPVSRRVVELFWSATGLNPIPLSIEHTMDLPQGCGFGTSGSGALSLALALNGLMGGPLSETHAASLAHRAEVECRTGLGSVLGAWSGGFLHRTLPGAPGTGSTQQLEYSDDLTGVALVFGPLSTSRLLATPEVQAKMKLAASLTNPSEFRSLSIQEFLVLSRTFADTLQLWTPALLQALNQLQNSPFLFSMLLFGEGLFTLVDSAQVPQLYSLLRPLGGQILSCPLDPKGARLL